MSKKRTNPTKRIIALTLILSLLFTFSSFTASANDEIKVLIDGKPITFDVPPQIINGRTLVPMRAIFEALGAQVEWDEKSKTIGAFKDSTIIIMTINQGTYLKNEELLAFDVAPQIISGRTLVPVRAIAECLNCKVTWDNASRTVFINISSDSETNTVSTFYNRTTIPTYESITGSNLLRVIDEYEPIKEGMFKEIYVYAYTASLEAKYVSALQQSGFIEIQNFDEFRVFANTATGNQIILQGANGGDGSGTLWIRVGLITPTSNSNNNSSSSSLPSNNYYVYKGTTVPCYDDISGDNYLGVDDEYRVFSYSRSGLKKYLEFLEDLGYRHEEPYHGSSGLDFYTYYDSEYIIYIAKTNLYTNGNLIDVVKLAYTLRK